MSTPKMMSVDRAIQRELAYRRRMEALQFGLHNASSCGAIPTIPIRNSSLLSTLGTKRKSPFFDSSLVFPPQQPHSLPESAKRTHRSSLPINAKISCTVCKESFPNTFYLDKHCQSAQHQYKIAMSRNGHINVSNPFMCEICQATSSSRVTLEQHLLGKRHKQAMEGRTGSSKPIYPHFDISSISWESV